MHIATNHRRYQDPRAHLVASDGRPDDDAGMRSRERHSLGARHADGAAFNRKVLRMKPADCRPFKDRDIAVGDRFRAGVASVGRSCAVRCFSHGLLCTVDRTP